jgi:hypothetical protein
LALGTHGRNKIVFKFFGELHLRGTKNLKGLDRGNISKKALGISAGIPALNTLIQINNKIMGEMTNLKLK